MMPHDPGRRSAAEIPGRTLVASTIRKATKATAAGTRPRPTVATRVPAASSTTIQPGSPSLVNGREDQTLNAATPTAAATCHVHRSGPIRETNASAATEPTVPDPVSDPRNRRSRSPVPNHDAMNRCTAGRVVGYPHRECLGTIGVCARTGLLHRPRDHEPEGFMVSVAIANGMASGPPPHEAPAHGCAVRMMCVSADVATVAGRRAPGPSEAGPPGASL